MSARFAAILQSSLKTGSLLLWMAASAAMLSPLYLEHNAHAKETKAPDAPATCATCHAGVVRSFATAPMRHAMETDGANPELIAHPDLRTSIGPYTYRVQTRDGHSTYSVTDGVNTLSAPIHWIFGQHTQTWILEKDGAFYETLVSYYPRDNTLAITPDDEKIKPKTLREAMGRRLLASEVRTCFDCHASGVVTGEKLEPSKTTPGIACERCHAGSQEHMADAARDNFKTLPMSFKHLDAQQISDFCGHCHRRFDTVMRDRLHGNGTVRFQPYRLELSKCFIGNDPRISCLACHNPHQHVDHEVAHYDAKCLACHSQTKRTTNDATVNCPVAKSNCTSCHMPKVEIAGNHAQFTDHYIRVVRPGEGYPE